MTQPSKDLLNQAYTVGREWKHAPDQEYQRVLVSSVLEGVNSPPPDPDPGGEVEVDRVVQRSFTWTFSGRVQVGRYVNGDWWVVGPVTITSIEPACVVQQSGRIMNGSMLNPSVGWISGSPGNGYAQGFDNGCKDGNVYNPELNVGLKLPLTLQPGTSLISARSNPTDDQRPQLLEAEILTVVRKPPRPNSFRPPCYGNWDLWWPDEAVYSGWLPDPISLPLRPRARGAGVGAHEVRISGSNLGDTYVSPLRAVERPWFHPAPDPAARPLHPAMNMPVYGAEIADTGGACALRSMDASLVEEDRRKLVVGLTQIGIDFYGITRANGFRKDHWLIGGGHASGVIGPILYAENVLYQGGVSLDDFGQSFRIAQHDVTFNETHQTYYLPDGTPEWCSQYARSTVGCPKSWEDPTAKGIAYRTSDTARAWWGWAAALEQLGLRDSLNHEAFFDYQKRYYEEQVIKRGATAPQQTIATLPWTLDCWKQINGIV